MVTLKDRLNDINDNLSDYVVDEYVRQYKSMEKWIKTQSKGKSSIAYPNSAESGALDIDAYEMGKIVDKSRLKMDLESIARAEWNKVSSGEIKRLPSLNQIIHKMVQKQAFAFTYKQGYAQFLHDVDAGIYGDKANIVFNPTTNERYVTGVKYNPFIYQSKSRNDEVRERYIDLQVEKKNLFDAWKNSKSSMGFEEFLDNYINSLNGQDDSYAKFLRKKFMEGKINDSNLYEVSAGHYDLAEEIGEEYYTYGS